jgi:Arc/MetJ family transcription regulator
VLDRLGAAGVGAVPVPGGVRMVTHVDVDDEGIATAIDAWRSIAAEAAKEAS